jgi:hypothetical protein
MVQLLVNAARRVNDFHRLAARLPRRLHKLLAEARKSLPEKA